MRTRGHVMVEWMVGLAIGMTLVAASISVFTQQLHALRETVWRQRRERDLQEVMEHLRRELRRAGMSPNAARTSEHDTIVLEGSGSTMQAHYRSDPSDPTRPTGRSSLRISSRAMQWRSPSTGGFQQLSDAQVLPMAAWSVQMRALESCRSLLQISLMPDGPVARTRSLAVRRRNEGGTACAAP